MKLDKLHVALCLIFAAIFGLASALNFLLKDFWWGVQFGIFGLTSLMLSYLIEIKQEIKKVTQ